LPPAPRLCIERATADGTHQRSLERDLAVWSKGRRWRVKDEQSVHRAARIQAAVVRTVANEMKREGRAPTRTKTCARR
jgi:hypothetical protein